MNSNNFSSTKKSFSTSNKRSKSKSKKKKSKSKSIRQTKNNFNNIIPSSKRLAFYEKLDESTHKNYILTLLKIGLEIEKKLCTMELKYKKFTLKIKKHENSCMEFFGGSLFFILFLESEKLGLFNEDDYELLSQFLNYKTIDIDISAIYEVKPKIKNIEDESLIKEIMSNFGKQYHIFIKQTVNDIIEQNPEIQSFLTFLSEDKNFKGNNFGHNNLITPFLGPNGIFSISLKIDTDVLELRPQINTCIEENCDHILEIITILDESYNKYLTNIYDLSIIDSFFGRNILLLCVQNIDRMYRQLIEVYTGTKFSEKTILLLFKNYFKLNPDAKTKYMQGFYRVELIYIILEKLVSKKSPKFSNLKKLFIPNKELVKRIRKFIVNNKIITILLPSKLLKSIISTFNNLEYKIPEKEYDLNTSLSILSILIDVWSTIHSKVKLNFKKDDVELTSYSLPPNYSSSNEEDEKLHFKIGRELDINFDDSDWENTITNDKIRNILKRLNINVMPITPKTKKIIIKKIKKKLNLV